MSKEGQGAYLLSLTPEERAKARAAWEQASSKQMSEMSRSKEEQEAYLSSRSPEDRAEALADIFSKIPDEKQATYL